MDSRNGDLYASREAGVAAGVPLRHLVDVIGTKRGIGRLRMAAKNEAARRKAKRKTARASRSANRR